MNRFLFVLALGAVVATPTFAQTPTAAQQQAIRSNCVSDFRANCSGVPTGGMDALVCLEQHVDSLSPGCKSAVEAVEPAASSSASSPSTTSSAAASSSTTAPSSAAAPSTAPSTASGTASAPASVPSVPPPKQPELSLRQEMGLAAGSCAIDFRLLCPNLPVGHGNILFCLKVHAPRLSPRCHAALVNAGVVL